MNFLFEIGLEELPARYENKLEKELEKLISEKLKEERIGYKSLKSYSTPRRLAVLIEGLTEKQEELHKKSLGPSVEVSFKDGKYKLSLYDTVDLEEIRDAVDHLPIVGVTSNPSIVKKTSPKDFFGHMREIRKIIGDERSLHIQVIATEADEIVKEAHKIFEEVDDKVYVKVPTTYEGVKAMKILKAEGKNVTATAVYDLMQAYMALAAGADYIAPYTNRIGNLGNDPFELMAHLSNRIVEDGYDCKILAASFKGVQQVRDAFNAGSQAITAPVSVLKAIFENPSISKAVTDFNNDWYSVYGEDKGLCDM